MLGSFSVGALAIAESDGNAIGAVRLTVQPDHLELDLLKVGAFKESFVPGALTERVRYDAPYTAIRALVSRGDTLVLTLDPRSPTPYTRFALTCFTDLPLDALAVAHKRRSTAIFLRRIVPIPAGIAAAIAVPAELASGAAGRAAVGMLATLAALALAHLWVRVRSWGGPFSERLRDALERRIAERLAIALPGVALAPEVELPDVATPIPVPLPRAARSPVSTGRARNVFATAFGLSLAAAFSVGALALYRHIERGAPPATATSETEPSTTNTADETIPALPAPSCRCDRPDSPLWSTDLPALSLMLLPRQHDESGKPASVIAPVMRKGAGRYDFEVAIVNNAATPLHDIRIVLTFARRNKKGERIAATDRGLFWAGDLGPAESVKWNVEAPGTELRIDLDEKRTLGAAKGQLRPASADAFVKLLAAKVPAIRLHGALMLAYLHDPRAREAAENLSGLSDADETTRDMIARASAPFFACRTTYDAGAIAGCAVNEGESSLENGILREVGPDGRKVPLSLAVPPHTGVSFRVDGFGPPAEEIQVEKALPIAP